MIEEKKELEFNEPVKDTRKEMDYGPDKKPIEPKPQKPEWKQTKMASGTLHESGDNRIVEESTDDFKSKQYRVGGTQGKVYKTLDEAKESFNQPKPNHSAKFDELIKHAHNTFEPEYRGKRAAEGFIQDYEFGNMDEKYDPKKNYKLTDDEKSYIHEQFGKLRPDYTELTDDELKEELYDGEYWYGNAKTVDEVAKALVDRTHISPERAKEFASKYWRGADTWSMEELQQKPLHIRSLENQVSFNSHYQAMADSITKDERTNDAYFYAFKDAFEKSGYNPSKDDLMAELSDAYWRLADEFRDSRGMSQMEWDRYGEPEFERKFGSEADFIENGITSYTRFMNNLGSPQK